MMNYAELRRYLAEQLFDRENIQNEINWMIEAFSGLKPPEVDPEAEITKWGWYKRAVVRLQNHEPFQYVIGSQDFYDGTFIVTPSVLVPRPETELLCSLAIKWGEGRENVRALDLCTGSGCIAITLAKHLKGSFRGSDISHDALEIAQKNNALNHTDVEFFYSDLWFHINKGESFDLVTANPPYLTQKEMTEIPLEVTHEPFIALDGGPTGIYAIERILKDLKRYLLPGGLFLMEIGEKQGPLCLELAAKYELEDAVIAKDLNGKDRIFSYIRKS